MERPKRKQNRLAQYDYSRPGWYFITICTMGKAHLLWEDGYAPHTRVGADIIRTDADYLRVWDYIHTNPARWREDCYFTKTEG